MRVLAKNQLRFEICENAFKFPYENLDEKLIFTHFQFDISGPWAFYTTLENNAISLQQFFRFREIVPLPCGLPCTMYIKINFYLSTVIIVIEYEARTSVENRQPRNILQNKLDFVSKLIETFPSDNKDRPSPRNPVIMSLKNMRQHSEIVSNKYK